jgi:formamidopyrimidine-DNA glycosylase
LPELPEVEISKRGLEPLLGASVAQVNIYFPTLRWPIPTELSHVLPQAQLTQLSRRAKYILVEFSNSQGLLGTMLLHLGMSGRLCLLPAQEPRGKHDHIEWIFDDGRILRLRDPRRFGAVLWIAAPNAEAQAQALQQHPLLTALGPEPLLHQFDAEYLYRRSRGKSSAVKLFIMDSHVVVGVGNIYASESLFRAGIHPQKPARRLSLAQCTRLVEEIKATLAEAIQAGGSSLRDFFGADGNPGYFQQHYFVYGRTGLACERCQAAIQQIKQGQRSTFFCAKCQRK